MFFMAIPECRGEDYQDLVFLDDLGVGSRASARGVLDKRENVLFIGNPGTGKTHLVCALTFSACAQSRSVRFYTATDLVTQLVECREEKRLQRLHKQLQRLYLLVGD
jgi:DNA replication protein DnaC